MTEHPVHTEFQVQYGLHTGLVSWVFRPFPVWHDADHRRWPAPQRPAGLQCVLSCLTTGSSRSSSISGYLKHAPSQLMTNRSPASLRGVSNDRMGNRASNRSSSSDDRRRASKSSFDLCGSVLARRDTACRRRRPDVCAARPPWNFVHAVECVQFRGIDPGSRNCYAELSTDYGNPRSPGLLLSSLGPEERPPKLRAVCPVG